jgi:mRNA-degrading endonuclease toxin of MazEF toxin-antitoxin module
MKQWDIYLYPFPDEKPHPVVILSVDEWCENEDFLRVNGLLCTSAQLNRGPKKNEIILDHADGLDWKTGVRCDFVHALPKADFRDWRGTVSAVRRREIARKLAECFRLSVG